MMTIAMNEIVKAAEATQKQFERFGTGRDMGLMSILSDVQELLMLGDLDAANFRINVVKCILADRD